MALRVEMETFNRELPRLLLEHEGEYVLIKGDRVDSFWKTEGNRPALLAGNRSVNSE